MSSSMSTSPSPASLGPRFSEYTATDHQAPLWIATILTVAYAGIFLIVRIAVKFQMLGLDDIALGVAYVSGITQWAVVYAALHKGVGMAIPTSPESTVATLVYVSRLLTLLTLGFSKCSVLLFLRQIFSGTVNTAWRICSGLFILTGLWTIVSTLIVSIDCSPNSVLRLENESHCSGDLTRWKVVTAFDVILEVILVAVPICLFYSVQITRSRKFTIFGAFAPRIVVPAIFVAYLEAYVHFRQTGGSSLNSVTTLIWQQILCGISLISATTPCLKGFLSSFRTGDLTRVTDGSASRTYTYNSGSKSNPETYALETIDQQTRKKEPKEELRDFTGHDGDVIHSANVYTANPGENGDGSVKSFGSQQMMIHHKIEFEVSSSTS